uniref:NADH dehydrogenase subunit 6 n=1 Tax=Chaetopterus variopedatus TaxID=34590 RepID=A0A0S2N0C6_CHAVR|nr:NADH dehydrogenase subunit 6 [Chaetopterus variopedatus]ALO81664.1 NADH dehydrogenase subunit 6 [Chaetopterus variopedatus]
MTLYMFLTMVSVLSFILPLMIQPLSFGLTLMFLTFFYALITSFLSAPWYAYMIFLIFIGGLLVMFAYIAALAPNSFFKTSKINSTIVGLLFIYLTTLFLQFDFLSPSLYTQFSTFSAKSSVLMYAPPMMPTLFFLIYILLLTMISVAKVCSFSIGPLRPFK